jgi:dihydroorotate dehydrogenase
MGSLYRAALRPLLFGLDSERAHDLTIAALSRLSSSGAGLTLLRALSGARSQPALPVEAFGLRFPNPLGAAAGLDKRGTALPAWEALGFGFCEIGGVTAHPQPGNDKPRMFRAVASHGIVNRMGFNNGGAAALAATLRGFRAAGRWPRHPVGINLGKSKVTPLEDAASDYASSFEQLADLGDFFVVNVSSPNTPGLRALQDRALLDEILAALGERNRARAAPRPILVKVAPDLSFDALDEILELVEPRRLAGIVATNTTIARPATDDPALSRVYAEAGGLSGGPLAARATEVIRHLSRRSGGKLPIIGVGGILDGDSALEKLDAGATLLQVYSGLVYEGPGLIGEILAAIAARSAAQRAEA